MANEMRESVELTDPRALRALAHPTRLMLVGMLRRAGPMTATQAAARIGESAASCSFHLRQLAKWGLVEDAGGGRGRERPWRATARSTAWKVTSAEQAEASAALSGLIVRYQLDRLMRALQRQPDEPAAWQRAEQLADTQLRLTASQLEELGERVWQVVRGYEEAALAAAGEEPAPGRADAARRVGIFFAAYPEADDEP